MTTWCMTPLPRLVFAKEQLCSVKKILDVDVSWMFIILIYNICLCRFASDLSWKLFLCGNPFDRNMP